MPLGLCIVGCGSFARTFVKELRSYRGLGTEQPDLLFASRVGAKARAYSRRFGGIGHFASYEEAAADPRVGAMYLCTPHSLHVEHALLAARHGKHILVEKPISRTLEEGEMMVSAAREAGVKLMVAENFRFMPPVSKARELVEQGAIGTLRLVQVQEESNFRVQGWRGSREAMGGGVFIDGGIHSVNMVLDLGGPATEVYAAHLPPTLEGTQAEDGVVLMARLESGATGVINHAWGISKRAWKLWVAVSGTRGRLYFRPRSPELTLETAEGVSKLRFPEDPTGIGRMAAEFARSIADDVPPPMSGEEGLRDLRMVLGAYRSAETGKPVTLG